RGRRRRHRVRPARTRPRRGHRSRNIRGRVWGTAGTGGVRVGAAMRRPVPYVVATAAGVVVIMLAYLVVLPHGGSSAAAREPVEYGPCSPPAVGITVAVSPEKRDVMNTLAARYNTSSRLFGGRCARVDVFAESSGQTMESLAGSWNPEEHATKPRPQVWIPA